MCLRCGTVEPELHLYTSSLAAVHADAQTKYATRMLLQVEILFQGRQSCAVYGHLRSWIPGQHASSAVWGVVSPLIFVLHGAHPLGSISCHGYGGLCIFIPVYLQDFCLCEG